MLVFDIYIYIYIYIYHTSGLASPYIYDLWVSIPWTCVSL